MKLTALDIERVDAVDKPATGRRFVLIKAAESEAASSAAPEPVERAAPQVGAVLAAARAVLAACAGAELSPEQQKALASLAAALGEQPAATRAADDAVAKAADDDDDNAVAAADEGALDTDLTALGRAVAGAMAPYFTALHDALTGLTPAKGVAKAALPPSRQMMPVNKGTDGLTLGDGLFADVVFGQAH